VLVRWPAQEMAHSILSAVLAGHVRFLAPLVEDHLGLPEALVWEVVRDALLSWRARHPEPASTRRCAAPTRRPSTRRAPGRSPPWRVRR
jgi:siderophore synthetase component